MTATLQEMNDLRGETSPAAFARKAKRVLDRFTISEISAVDSPAQKHALVRIMKKKADDDADEITSLQSRIADLERDIEAKRSTKKRKDSTVTTSFGELARALAKRDGLAPTEAMRKARLEHPDAFDAYRAEPLSKRGDDEVEKRRIMRGEANARQAAADAVAARDKVSKLEALRRTRRERPQLFEDNAA